MSHSRFPHPRALALVIWFCALALLGCMDMGCESSPAEQAPAPPAEEGTNRPAQAQEPIPENEIFTVTSAGRWFTGDGNDLAAEVDGYLKAAKKVEFPGPVLGLVSPHAGFVYSGPVAAWSYRQVQGLKFDTVIVVGFNHGTRPEGIAVYGKGGFRTPLGVIPIDGEMAGRLIEAHDLIRHNPSAFQGEHSLDNQLPFLQRALTGFKLVPVLLCAQHQKNLDALAGAIAKVAAGKKVLLVASSDMSHFWSHEEAKKLDEAVLEKILAMDSLALQQELVDDPTGRRLCGRGAIQVVMEAAKRMGADQARLLKYADSQDTSGSASSRGVVGYCAVAFTGSSTPVTSPAGEPSKEKNMSYPGELDHADQARLLEIARQSLTARVKDETTKPFTNDRPNLEKKRGVFVTLKIQDRLRGCMGHFENDTALHEIVAKQVLVSAMRDPRFSPVRPEELDQISIEISVLSVPKKVASYEEIQVGLHGVIFHKEGRGSTFLPQVAPEQGWDRDTMLSYLAQKAGLPRDAWKSGATFEVYTAQVFGETE